MAYTPISPSSLTNCHYYVNEPFVNMRETPAHTSKVVSQAIFSEKVSIEKTHGDWSYITTPDGYSGWVFFSSIILRSQPYEADLKTTRLAAHVFQINDIEYGPILTLPYGSRIKSLDVSDTRWVKIELPSGQTCFIQKGDVSEEAVLNSKKDLVKFSSQFLGLPYTWGGRSSFGFDCSGFVQMLYNQIGIQLQRDACQQILDERFQKISIEQLEPGDLIFFGTDKDSIKHVGMSIGELKFIHATSKENKPWIRISSLSDFEWSADTRSSYPYRAARQLKVNEESQLVKKKVAFLIPDKEK